MHKEKTTLITLLAVALVASLSAQSVRASNGLEDLMPHYEAIRAQLIEDSAEQIEAPAQALLDALEILQADLTAETAGVPPEKLEDVEDLLPEAIQATKTLVEVEEIEAARAAFFALTKPLVRWRQAAGQGPAVAYCPMKKQSWLQPRGDKIGNPYYGQAMPTCGEIVEE